METMHHLYKKDKAELLITQGFTNPSQGTAVDRLIAYEDSDLITIKQ